MTVLRVIFQTVLMALSQVWANKLRSFLTALGIIIGVAAVTAVIAGLNGMKQFVLDEFSTFGAKMVFVDGERPESMRGKVSWRDVQLDLTEVRAIADNCEAIERITPIWWGGYPVRSGDVIREGVPAMGIWPQWHEIENRYVIRGRPFSTIDEDEGRQVCLINEQAIVELELDRDPVGDIIYISDRRFEIVGIVETKDLSAMFGGNDTRTEVFVPFSVARRLNPFGWINYALAQLRSPEEADEVVPQIRHVLRTMRGLQPEDEDTFSIGVAQQFIDQFKKIASVLTAVAGGIVGISLLVGGVGIMNIMLVSVSERTREIGLRKAVGARPAVILLQFLTEAVTLCLVGGYIGLVMGQALALLINQAMPEGFPPAVIPTWAVVLAFGFSTAVGLIFGMWPAIKASRLDPIEALRHE
ncbi:MAG: ABC transporter permease [Phycisphaerales bacterium]